MNNLIFCRFLDENNNPRGREYTYNADCEIKQGDYVLVEVAGNAGEPKIKKVVVTKAGVNPNDVPGYENFKDKIKSIIGLATEESIETEKQNIYKDVPIVQMEDL